MVHFYYFISRKPEVSETEFHRYWREVHGPIAARIPQFRRYIQSHRIPFAGSNLPFDGAAEIWLDDIEAVVDLRREPIFRDGALRDEPNFIDIDRVEWVVSDDHVMLDGPQGAGMAKAVFRFRHKPGMRLKHFRRYWLDVHGALGLQIPGLRRYVQSHTVDAAYLYAEPRWDAIAQLWFDDERGLEAALKSPHWNERVLPDGYEFIEMESLTWFAAREHHVIR